MRDALGHSCVINATESTILKKTFLRDFLDTFKLPICISGLLGQVQTDYERKKLEYKSICLTQAIEATFYMAKVPRITFADML